MRKEFLEELQNKLDPKHDFFLTADVGFGHLESIKQLLGSHFINVGIREQLMIGMAAGIALSGYRVFTYTMCAFYLRAVEQIRDDIVYHNANVKLIGVGPEREYGELGFTHWAEQDDDIVSALGVPVFNIMNTEDIGRALPLINGDPVFDKKYIYMRVSR